MDDIRLHYSSAVEFTKKIRNHVGLLKWIIMMVLKLK